MILSQETSIVLNLTAAFAAFPTLETERLVLRAPQPDDATSVFRIMSNPLVTRYFGTLPMTQMEEATEKIEGWTSAFREQCGIRWAVTQRASGAYLGSCGFWRLITRHFRAEIGYELDPAAWGQGIMPEAAASMVEFGFTVLGLHTIEAQIHPENTGSQRVLQKLGFVQEGYFRENYYEPAAQCFTDSAVFSLLHADWSGNDQSATSN